jgi:hypothetical protein
MTYRAFFFFAAVYWTGANAKGWGGHANGVRTDLRLTFLKSSGYCMYRQV